LLVPIYKVSSTTTNPTIEQRAERAEVTDMPADRQSTIDSDAGAAAESCGLKQLATVFGGGGVFGIAYNLGVGEAFVDAGIDLGSAAALGTSAGAWAAAHLALGLRFQDSYARFVDKVPRRPDLRRGRLAAICRDVFGADTICPTVRVAVVALPSFKREVLLGADHAVADLVAASSAVPGMLASQRISGVRYVDGGLRSMASADLGDEAARLLVVLPMSGPMFGPAGRVIERRTVREIESWGGRAAGPPETVVRATARIAGLVRRPDHLFDPARAQTCHALAYAQGVELAHRWSRSATIAA
jgi:NTE family protein